MLKGRLAWDSHAFLRAEERFIEFIWLFYLCLWRTETEQEVVMAALFVPSLPLVDGRFTNAKALRKSSCAVGAYRNLGSYGRRGACVFVQGDHHDKAPGWTAEVMHRLSINCRMTSLAMNSGYRFESMQSSGMRQLGMVDLCQRLPKDLLNQG